MVVVCGFTRLEIYKKVDEGVGAGGYTHVAIFLGPVKHDVIVVTATDI